MVINQARGIECGHIRSAQKPPYRDVHSISLIYSGIRSQYVNTSNENNIQTIVISFWT